MARLSIELSRGRLDVHLHGDEAATDAMVETWRAIGEHALDELDSQAPDDTRGRVVLEIEITPIDEGRT